ncbi:hypothetical protein BABINDRAFT_16514, partial [Babjeviella inositovora NRRL Y-12698]
GIPYDYIVIIDAGSKGSRVFVYHWLNPKYLFDHQISIADFPVLKRDYESESDDDDDDTDDDDKDKGKNKDKGNNKDEKKSWISTKPHWHTKIKPGIATFKDSSKLGSHHLQPLLDAAAKIVPKSQHSRTPIFLHATGGVRSLTPSEQTSLLADVCKYLTESAFFLPDCATHVNAIDGDIEGLYAWLSINQLMGTFNTKKAPLGLLDMGGASTQLAFQPNATEIKEHEKSLLKVQLAALGSSKAEMSYDLYSSSFMGFGMYQGRGKYLDHLFNATGGVTTDPCLPANVPAHLLAEDTRLMLSNRLAGSGDFTRCMQTIFPVLEKQSEVLSLSCKPDVELSCLLNDLIPALDFHVEQFIGVSGYWDTIFNLLDKNVMGAYEYDTIFAEATKLCNTPWDQLVKLNTERKTPLGDEDLSQLCFKSAWVLSFLHSGLGFPRYGIDKKAGGYDTFKVVDKVDDVKFSWTLGRAVLYASSEASEVYGAQEKTLPSEQVGFYHQSSKDRFFYGGEAAGVKRRPAFVAGEKDKEHDDDSWKEKVADHLEDHRGYGALVFLGLLLLILYLLMGKERR